MSLAFDLRHAADAHGLDMPQATPERETHLVLIPSYNSGRKLVETVQAARRHWAPVWVVVDGSTDGSDEVLGQLTADDPQIRIYRLPRNQGKGAAILHGLRHAEAQGFTHVLTMDADGQHPAALIPDFIAVSQANPDALILGRPIFDASAPRIRVLGRKLSNWGTNLETLWGARFDSLFGFRVYPVGALRRIMEASRWMRRFDFDAEAAVRLCWIGLRPISLPAPVQYFTRDQGGVSHFKYLRDNVLLTWMHARLVAGFVLRLPVIVPWRLRSSRH